MGTKQSKVCQASSAGGDSPQHHPPGTRRSAPSRDRGDFWASFGVKSGDKFGKNPSGGQAPYHRRIRMIQDMMGMLRQGRHEEATEELRHLRQMQQHQGSILIRAHDPEPMAGPTIAVPRLQGYP